ncbi:MAG: MurR/RpiR family transcriptional regulator [Eubacteriales bacterium]
MTDKQNNPDLLRQIEAMLPTLSKSRRAVGRFIIDRYDKAAYMTASKLGESVSVSESTVVRFAIELGFAGYPELQHSLRELIRTKLTSVQRLEVANTRIGDGDLLEKVMQSDAENIRATLETLDRANFAGAVDALDRSKMIYIVGMRSAAPLASFLAFYLRLVFEHVRLVATNSGSELFEQLLRIGEGDTLFAVTFPRYSTRVVKAVEYAAAAGAHVIALTDSPSSPIAEKADSLLLAKSDMASFVDSLTAPLSVVNALIVAVSRRRQAEITDTFAKLEKIWEEYEVYEKPHDE